MHFQVYQTDVARSVIAALIFIPRAGVFSAYLYCSEISLRVNLNKARFYETGREFTGFAKTDFDSPRVPRLIRIVGWLDDFIHRTEMAENRERRDGNAAFEINLLEITTAKVGERARDERVRTRGRFNFRETRAQRHMGDSVDSRLNHRSPTQRA